MKLKLPILLTVLFAVATSAFGQKETTKPTTETKVKTETKTTETKTAVETKTPAAKTPTAQEILTKYVQAIGGRANYEKIKSRFMKGTLEIPAAGIKGSFENYTAAPGKSINKATLAGVGEITEGFDGTNAWTIDPIQGNREKKGEELAQTKLIYNFYRDINLDKLYPKMEVRGTEKLADKDVYVLVGTPTDNLPAETFYFDAKSGLLLRQDSTIVSPEGKMPTTTFFEDVRDVDGVKMPFKVRSVLPQFEIVITFTEIKNNVAVQDAMFVKPKV